MTDRLEIGRSVLQVNDTTLEEHIGQHDLLTVRATRYNKWGDHEGKPVALYAKKGAQSRLIVGYLDTHAQAASKATERSSAGFILGASMVMRSGHTRQWRNKRPFEIAKDVVTPHGFCLEMDRCADRIPLFIQSTESDWQLLNRLAAEIGMQLIGTNVVVRIVDPVAEVRRRWRNNTHLVYDINTLTHYRYSGSYAPLGTETRVFEGVDKYGVSFKVVSTPTAGSRLPSVIVTQSVASATDCRCAVDPSPPVTLQAPEIVKSLGDAITAAERLARRSYRMRSAEATVKYNPFLRSGTSVTLTNGFEDRTWFIVQATHRRTRMEEMTELVLNRDEDLLRPAVLNTRRESYPIPKLLKGKWVAAPRWEREL